MKFAVRCQTLDNAGIVLIAPPRTGSDSTETPVPQSYFSIRWPYVVRALHWLKNHNTLYRDIEIEEVSDDAPSSQTAANEIALDGEGESSVIRRDLQLPNIEVSNVINNNNNAPVHQLQHVQGAPPLSAYTHVLMLNRWPFGCIRMAIMGIKHHVIHP